MFFNYSGQNWDDPKPKSDNVSLDAQNAAKHARDLKAAHEFKKEQRAAKKRMKATEKAAKKK